MQYYLFHDYLHTRIKINGSSITTNNKNLMVRLMVEIEKKARTGVLQ